MADLQCARKAQDAFCPNMSITGEPGEKLQKRCRDVPQRFEKTDKVIRVLDGSL